MFSQSLANFIQCIQKLEYDSNQFPKLYDNDPIPAILLLADPDQYQREKEAGSHHYKDCSNLVYRVSQINHCRHETLTYELNALGYDSVECKGINENKVLDQLAIIRLLLSSLF